VKVIFGILVLLSVNAFAGFTRRVTFTVGSPMPTSYSASDAKSLIASELLAHRNLSLVNYTGYDIDCVFGNSSSTAPTVLLSQVPNGISLVASEHVVLNNFMTSKNMYCKGTNAAVVSGTLTIIGW